jgi:hypothetical protein
MLNKILAKRQRDGLLNTLAFLRRRLLRIVSGI